MRVLCLSPQRSSIVWLSVCLLLIFVDLYADCYFVILPGFKQKQETIGVSNLRKRQRTSASEKAWSFIERRRHHHHHLTIIFFLKAKLMLLCNTEVLILRIAPSLQAIRDRCGNITVFLCLLCDRWASCLLHGNNQN